MLNVIIFGAPGSGKGTQSAVVKEHYNLEHISTGDMLRSEIKKGSPIGKKADSLIANGQLVPDEVIVEMMENRMDDLSGKSGVIFDGFPRTVEQAKALEEMLEKRGQSVTLLIELSVEEKELVQRILERGKVSHRADDNEDSVRNRLQVYHSETEPVINYFAQQDKYISVDGMGEISEITERIIHAIDANK